MTRQTKFKALDPRAILPTFAYPGDLGMDFAIIGDHVLNPGESRDLPSGLAAEPAPGYGLRITGRSSTLRSRGLFINEGIIDAGYRGELKTYVTNMNATPAVIEHGTRLAQLIPMEVVTMETAFVDELAPSPRGDKGFGSTGTSGSARQEEQGGPIRIYLGGPIDYAADPMSDWREDPEWKIPGATVWNPAYEGIGREDEDIMESNARALARAQIAVFDLRMDFPSVGTPIEAWTKANDGFGFLPQPKALILIHPRKPGLFVKAMVAMGGTIADSPEEARALVAGMIDRWTD